jgi:hypothetical protein
MYCDHLGHVLRLYAEDDIPLLNPEQGDSYGVYRHVMSLLQIQSASL